MLTKRTNFHHSKLPNVGELVTLRLSLVAPPTRKFRVVAYPLCDNVLPYSLGIHTVYLQALDNAQELRVSGHLCQSIY